MDPEVGSHHLELVAEIDPAARPYVSGLIRRVHDLGAVQVGDDALSVVCTALARPGRGGPGGYGEDGVLVEQPHLVQSTILQLIHRGASAAEVAAVLNLDLAGISDHLRQARRRYSTSSTAQAIVRALAAGDIS